MRSAVGIGVLATTLIISPESAVVVHGLSLTGGPLAFKTTTPRGPNVNYYLQSRRNNIHDHHNNNHNHNNNKCPSGTMVVRMQRTSLMAQSSSDGTENDKKKDQQNIIDAVVEEKTSVLGLNEEETVAMVSK